MKFDFETILKIALTIGGCLSIFKGLNDGFISRESIERASWVRLLLGFVFILLGLFLIYFADLFPPVTDFLRPFVTSIVDAPKSISSWAERKGRSNF